MIRVWFSGFPACMAAVLGIVAWEAADDGAPAACAIVSILAFMFAAVAVGIGFFGEDW